MEQERGSVHVSKKRTVKSRLKYRQISDYILFMGPSITIFTILFLIPLMGEILYSFTDWNGVAAKFNFVGLYNYIRTFRDKTYWKAMWFTVKFSFFVVVISNLLAFGWALILSRELPLRNFWRALIYVPRIVGGVILGFLWRFIFQNVLVQFGEWSGISWFSQKWFTTPESSFWALVIVMTWTLSGYLMLIYGAGFATISMEYMEAARIDGASRIQVLFRITIPMLTATITRCLFIAINWAMLLYDTNISLTNGNPFRSSEGVTMNIYATAFKSDQMAFGAAKSVIFILIVGAVSFGQFYLTSRKEVEL